MAEGRSFTVPMAGRSAERIKQTFWYRLKVAVKRSQIGDGSKFRSRIDNEAGVITFWCVKWVPVTDNSTAVDPPEHLRGEGWADTPAEPLEDTILVDKDQPIPRPRRGRVSRGTLEPLDEFPFAFMGPGRSFEVSFADRDTTRVLDTFWYRFKRCAVDGHIGLESKFCSRINHDAKTITFWCTEWVPAREGHVPMDPGPYNNGVRGKGWDDPAEAEPLDELI
ncbi:MAG: hypothetical protein Q7Q73_16815 [Verrucomicrobiota bacterium JB024]|nr:hypothetical protein [Verrucomicrobiota bacterium JB024]